MNLLVSSSEVKGRPTCGCTRRPRNCCRAAGGEPRSLDGRSEIRALTGRPEVSLQRVVLKRHQPLIERWLRSPHAVRWWGIQEAFLSTLARRSPDSHAVIMAGDRPVGYLCWQPLTREEREAAQLHDLPEDVVDIDILIGEPDCIGQGIGPQALRLLLERLAGDGVELAGLGTSAANRWAIRAFEKAGFGLVRSFDGPDGQYRYMVAELGHAV